jgi:cellulose biosynthesis protein BcsQ
MGELANLYGKNAILKPFLPERIAVTQAEGFGTPICEVKTTGAREVAGIFDQYLSTLLRK